MSARAYCAGSSGRVIAARPETYASTAASAAAERGSVGHRERRIVDFARRVGGSAGSGERAPELRGLRRLRVDVGDEPVLSRLQGLVSIQKGGLIGLQRLHGTRGRAGRRHLDAATVPATTSATTASEAADSVTASTERLGRFFEREDSPEPAPTGTAVRAAAWTMSASARASASDVAAARLCRGSPIISRNRRAVWWSSSTTVSASPARGPSGKSSLEVRHVAFIGIGSLGRRYRRSHSTTLESFGHP